MRSDLKCSNVLVNHRNEVRVTDFGLARECVDLDEAELEGKSMTTGVVTFWNRAPELLLGATLYGPPVDMWAVGCLLGELLTGAALFQGRTEAEQPRAVFSVCGSPTYTSWPAYTELRWADAVVGHRAMPRVLRRRVTEVRPQGGWGAWGNHACLLFEILTCCWPPLPPPPSLPSPPVPSTAVHLILRAPPGGGRA